MEELIVIAIILIVWYLFKCWQSREEGFSSKPNTVEAQRRASEMLQYKETFTQDMYKAREKMPWMDAIIYEEARARLRHGQFNHNKLTEIFR
jgi:hypothetical protein